MSQCMTCQFYDRKSARATDTRGLQWGLCRRDAPHLNTVNAKAHAIEGIWPTVRDDDWCGQWQAIRRAAAGESRAAIVQTPAEGPASIRAQPGRPLPLAGGAAAIAAGYKPTPGKLAK
ncbi:MAG: hypothetical protein ABI920_00815 [Casimicrobiaceae bacterium]